MKLFLSDISSLSGSKQEMQALGSRLLLKHALFCTYGLSLDQAGLKKDDFGKPYFESAPHIYFNLSHSDRFVFCGLDNSPLGVDIEKIRPIKPNLASRFFTPEETAYLKKLPPTEEEKAFFQIWTAKESYMKATGKGFTLPLNQILLYWNRHLAQAADGTLPSLHFHHYNTMESFSLCVCSPKDHFPKNWEMVRLFD